MHIGPNMIDFLVLSQQIHTEEDLRDLVSEATQRLGFQKFALVSHVDLIKESGEAVAISNYDDAWIDRILSRRYYLDDPLHAASTHTVLSFAWHNALKMIAATKRQYRILEEAASFGLADGVTVPVHAPGEYRGTCSFGIDKEIELTPQLRATTQLIASYSFEAARALIRARLGMGSIEGIPALSPRQVDCVGLLASGKGDAQIAGMLGLAEVTVHQHIREAMRRYGVFKRTALLFRALFDGQISFHKVR